MLGIGCSTGAGAQNVEPLLTAPVFVVGMLIVPLVAAMWLVAQLWRDVRWRRRVLTALASCLVFSLVSFVAVTRGSGPLTPIWGLLFLATPWWCVLAMLVLLVLRRRQNRDPEAG
jgi:hypothetical protein